MFEWDEAKRKRNLAKHGVDFDAIWDFEWKVAFFREDARRDYGETRYVAFAPIQGRLYCCTYTQREQNKRIISLRKANEKEEWLYEKAILDY